MPDFSVRLRELRKLRGLRQKDLAAALGLAQTTIANYERKLRFPDEQTLVRIANYFVVSLDELLGRTNDGAGAPVSAVSTSAAPTAAAPTSAPTSAAPNAIPPTAVAPTATAPFQGLAVDYFRALREQGPARARALLLAAMEGGRTLAGLYAGVIAPALHEVGRLWSLGELHAADEHAFSEATQQIMAGLVANAVAGAPSAVDPAGSAPRCTVFSVSGESHLIGARMVADLLSLAGVNVRFLGTNLSIGHVREALLASPPDLVALSVTLRENLNAAADTIMALRGTRALNGTRILVGGQAFNGDHAVARRMGADALAVDAEDAVRTALRLLAPRPAT